MSTPFIADIQVGWKVFAGAEQIGTVEAVGDRHLEVTQGWLRRHRYRIPTKYVAEATDGVVDLVIDPAAVDQFEPGRQDASATDRVTDPRLEAELPDPMDPAEGPPFAR